MKFFIDTANVNDIKQAAALGLADGVTTNPTLLARENSDPEAIYRQICKVVDGPVCAEAVSLNAGDIIEEGRKLAKIDDKIVIKIPATRDGLVAVKRLESENIHTNVTLVFSPMQALLAAKAGATFVCPFVGRLDDAGHEGMNLIAEILQIYQNYDIETRIVVASIRSVLHVKESAMLGAHVATIPLGVIEKLAKHPLTDKGVDAFINDWQKISRR